MTAPRMEFHAPVEAFLGLVSRVRSVIERINTIPILGNVVIGATEDGRISVEGADLELWARAESEAGVAEVSQAGATTVPASLLFDALKLMPKEKVRFASDGRMAVLSCRAAKIRLHEMPASDWPAPAIRADEPSIRLSLLPDQLREISTSVGFAMARDDTRPFLRGVLIEPEEIDGEMHLVAFATDGHRASHLVQPAEGDFAAMPRVILSRKTVDQLAAVADSAPETARIELDVTDRRVIFTAPGFRLYARLLDFTYPEYKHILPEPASRMAEVDTKVLQDAIKRVRIVAGDKDKEKVATFDFSEGRLALSMSSPQAGECSDEIATYGEAFDLRVGFQSQYVIDLLASLSAPRIRLGFTEAARAVRIDIPGNTARLMAIGIYALDKKAPAS